MPIGNGGVIGPANIPTTSVAKGVWSLMEQMIAKSQGIWPSAAIPGDPYFNYTTLLLPGTGTNGAQNNTFLDSSSNTFTITRNGNTTQGTFSPFSQTGWGNYFDGSGDYLNVTDAAFNPSGAFTIQFWFYPTDNTTTYQGLVSTWPDGLAPAQGIQIWKASSTGQVSIGNASTGGTTIASFTWASYLNQWNHLAVVRNGSDSCAVFLNGTRLASPVTKSGAPGQTALTIGRAFPNNANYYFQGYMSNVSFVSGSNVYDPASSTITVPTAPLSTSTASQALLTCQANRFVDSNTATTAKTITVAGNPSVQAFSPFAPSAAWSAATNGGSGYFDGTGDYLAAGSNAAWAMSTGDFSIEFWTYPTVLGVDGGYVSADYTTGFHVAQASGTLYFWVANSQINAASALSVNQWQHVVCTRASGTSRIFVNGVLKQTGANANSVAQNSLYIGTSSHALTEEITGYLANVRVVKGQIPTTYATSSTTIGAQIFTPPTSPLTTTSQGVTASNTSLLLNFTNAGIYDATSKNDLETVGSAQISTAINNPFGTASGSILFNGTSDYLRTPTSALYSQFAGSFTIEFWIYPSNTSAGSRGIVSTGYSANGLHISQQGANLVFYIGTTGLTATSVLTANTWQYIACVRSGSAVTIYKNGSSVATGTNSTSNSTVNFLTVGTSAHALTEYFAGYLQDVRITNGVARSISASPAALFPQS